MQGSARYQALPPPSPAKIDAFASALCSHLDRLVAHLSPAKKAALIAADQRASTRRRRMAA